jgi:hypothetical protein
MVERMAILSTALGIAACTGPNPYYLPPAAGCSAGERACDNGRPVECQAGGDAGTALVAARCPPGGGCMRGHCIPPMPVVGCQREADCAGNGDTCTPFVNQTGVALGDSCAKPEGATPGGLPCMTSSDCRSDLCLSVGGVGGMKICYLACAGDKDCPPAQKCRSLTVTVTGIQSSIQGCSPT